LKLNVNNAISVVQPDVMLFCEDELPCAVFEVLSPSTAYKDKTIKKELYEKSAIKEYFLVNVDFRIIEKFMLVDNRYCYIGAYGIEDTMLIDCLEQKLEVKEIFED
jgi:Uma2 family endonuclease